MLRSTRQHLRLGAGVVVAVVILLVPLVSILTSGEARAGAPTASATVLATVRINTLEVSLAAPGSVEVGEHSDVVATLKNLGSTKIMGAKATIHLPTLGTSTAFTLRGQADKNAGAVLPGKEKTVKWKLVADAAGNYVIMVTATGTEQESGDLLEAQDTALIEVVAGPAVPHPEDGEGTVPPSDEEHEDGTAPPSDEEHGEGTAPPSDEEHEERTVPPSDEEHEEGTVPPSDEEHEEGTVPPPSGENGEGTLPPSGGETGEGGVIDKALSGLRSVRDFFATLISI